MKEIFKPGGENVFRPTAGERQPKGDRRGRVRYVYSAETLLAVNVALATGRPLLVTGPSGCGKSSLAYSVAKDLGWRFYERVISSRTQAQDLLWEFDHLLRLNESRVGGELIQDLRRYIQPGPLWWAFNRASAERRGLKGGEPTLGDPSKEGDPTHAVVLLDEIDKADPDVPNNLLVPLGSLAFRVAEIETDVVAVQPPLLFITTNNERDLPVAFLRRCVELELKHPDREILLEIAEGHFGDWDFSFQNLPKADFFAKVADLVAWPEAGQQPGPECPSTAEYLDTVQACLQLEVAPGSSDYLSLSRATVWKHGRKEVG